MSELGVDQFVFGYRDGHELLASSNPLEARTARELLPHVDANFDDDAPHYLVGLPLKTIERYALIRIWPAPEISRPGAVWAHGLLFDPSAARHGTSCWLSAFKRPNIASLADFDERPTPPFKNPGDHSSRELVAGVAWVALAAPTERPVVLWHAVAEAEPALVVLRDALPIKAGWNLSFRTRGRARLGNSAYDLQVASNISGRPKRQATPILDLRRPQTQAVPRWARAFSSPTTEPELREFLHRYGDDDVTSRADSSALVHIWDALDGQRDAPSTLAQLLQSFPDPHSLRALRRELVGEERRHGDLWHLVEQDRLTAIADHPESFDADELELVPRLVRLWRAQRPAAVRIAASAISRTDVPVADSILDALAELADPRALPDLAAEPSLLTPVLARRSDLLETPQLWDALSYDEASGFLTEFAGQFDTARLASALLQSKNNGLLERAMALDLIAFGDLASAALGENDAVKQVKRIATQEAAVRDWLQGADLSASEAVTVLRALPLSVLRCRSLTKWRAAAEKLHPANDDASSAAASALLTLSLQSRGAASDAVLRETFAPVHRAIVEERLDDDHWQALQPSLPNAANWDRAERLRQVLVDRARSGKWGQDHLARALSGAGEHGARVTELVPKKSSFWKIVDAAVNGVADILR